MIINSKCSNSNISNIHPLILSLEHKILDDHFKCHFHTNASSFLQINMTLWLMEGGHSYWKVVWGCATFKTPFFSPFLALETHHFKPQALFQLQRPHFYFCEKFCFFKQNFHRFWLNFSSRDTNLRENLFQRPQFETKNSVLETLFLKTWVAHTYPKIFEYPPLPSDWCPICFTIWWYWVLILPVLVCCILKHTLYSNCFTPLRCQCKAVKW